MSWNYAELSKAAKNVGGPENLVNLIEENSRAEGRIEGQSSMVPWMGLAVLIASGITAGAIKLVDYFKQKKKISQAVVYEAKEQLSQGIMDYDSVHTKEDKDAVGKEESE